MPTHEAFLQEITAHPEDLTPRLVYADWLDEQGDPRGEFIRVQCELASIDETEDRYPALLRRERELLTEHRSEWLKPLKLYIRSGTFRCGFVERVKARLSTFLLEGEQIARMTPLRTVAFTSAGGNQLLHQLPTSPVLKQLAGLEFHAFRGFYILLSTLLGFPNLPNLRRLVISENWFHPQEFRQFLRADICANLKGLVLPKNHLKAYCFSDIAQSGLHLHQLDLSGNPEIWKGIRQLAEWSELPRLESLNLSQCKIHKNGLTRLLQSPHLGKLKHLAIGNNQFHHGHLHLIADNPSMTQLTALGLGNYAASTEDIVALTQSTCLTGLRRLNLALGSGYGDSLNLLSQWPGLAKLRQLRLTRNFGLHGFTEEELKRIVHSKYWNKNSILSITPFNAQVIRRTRENNRRRDGYSYELSEVPMGYLHDPVGVF